jgi:hypothetical protein
LPVGLSRGGFFDRDINIKVDGIMASSDGTATWSRIYGGDWDEAGIAMSRLQGGDLFVAGETSSFGAGESDGWRLLLDSTGKVERQSVFGSPKNDHLAGLAWAGTGTALAAGWSDSCELGNGTNRKLIEGARPWIAVGDPTGRWEMKSWCEGPKAANLALAYTPGGGFIVGGYELNSNADQVGLVRGLSATGEERWRVQFPETGEISTVAPRPGGYVIAGGSLLAILDFHGNLIWKRVYSKEEITVVKETHGNFVTVGSIQGSSGNLGLRIRRVSDDGAEIWAKDYFGALKGIHANAALVSQSGGLLVAGGSNQDAWLMKLYGNGQVIWQKTYGPQRNDQMLYNEFKAVLETPDDCIMALGKVQVFDSHDLWLVRLDDRGLMGPKCRTGHTFSDNQAF